MSDDLVKRLRDKWRHSEDDCYEAADRIEGLERALRNIAAVDVQSMALDALRPGVRIAPKGEIND